jgi:hypothetical protein
VYVLVSRRQFYLCVSVLKGQRNEIAVARRRKNLIWKLRDLGRKIKTGLFLSGNEDPGEGIEGHQQGKEI